ncbi:hypothetical protein [Halococcus salifodinae]|jgi:predicted RNA-binding Zn-ribbon protein involved in translation (DUF1610 family)|uniref:Small CPxCG-related zinc finger protein n=1 Tax=Halococcus salifodinae DSM 8989 TaxID=1227456 RepID=M0MYJ7_9EURY|nr:hypothetical protein [Halococcus salifodinae]EMA50676.1 hypothetical protein C450_13397 [Halococcus salifodinae DSM 8989]
MSEHRCPDCGVTMEVTKAVTSVDSESVKLKTDDKREGLLGSLGMKRTLGVDAYLCPECGLVRLYADIAE